MMFQLSGCALFRRSLPLGISLVLLPGLAFAEPRSSADALAETSGSLSFEQLRTVELAGLSKPDVIRLLGEPDRRSKSVAAENWYYGPATVFFSGESVAGWTNVEALSARQVRKDLSNDQNDSGEGDPLSGVGWQPEHVPSTEEVIDEIVEPKVQDGLHLGSKLVPPADGETEDLLRVP